MKFIRNPFSNHLWQETGPSNVAREMWEWLAHFLSPSNLRHTCWDALYAFKSVHRNSHADAQFMSICEQWNTVGLMRGSLSGSRKKFRLRCALPDFWIVVQVSTRHEFWTKTRLDVWEARLLGFRGPPWNIVYYRSRGQEQREDPGVCWSVARTSQ